MCPRPLPRAGSEDPFGGVENFDIDLAKVLCDVSVLPSLVTPLVDEEAAVGGTVADYAPPAAPAVEPVESSPFVPDSAKKRNRPSPLN